MSCLSCLLCCLSCYVPSLLSATLPVLIYPVYSFSSAKCSNCFSVSMLCCLYGYGLSFLFAVLYPVLSCLSFLPYCLSCLILCVISALLCVLCVLFTLLCVMLYLVCPVFSSLTVYPFCSAMCFCGLFYDWSVLRALLSVLI
jgi:hypothetical protein